MLFADAVGYSSLNEEQLPLFTEHFLRPIGEMVEQFKDQLLLKRTAGDGLFLVFVTVRTAGVFALALRDLFRGVHWARIGLPESIGIRIALDAGPIRSYLDPVGQRLEFCGRYVNREARLEPITPPEHVYASQSFAALAAAQNVTSFICDYVGQVPLPKGAGIIPTYHVRRRNDPE
jgi:class 3 adenylate cyclase